MASKTKSWIEMPSPDVVFFSSRCKSTPRRTWIESVCLPKAALSHDARGEVVRSIGTLGRLDIGRKIELEKYSNIHENIG